MNRRDLLAGAGLTVTAVAGCLSADDEDEEVEYEECPTRSDVRVSNLPDTAEEEARSAIEDGEYETNDDPLLLDVINVKDTYLRTDGSYYTIDVETDDGVTRLHGEETLREGPAFELITSLEDVTPDIRIEHARDDLLEEPVLVDEQLELDKSSIVAVFDENNYLGEHQFEVKIGDSEVIEKSHTVHRGDSGTFISISDDREVDIYPTGVVDRTVCRWNDDGEVEEIMG